jgi:hypothetical protein
MTTFSRHLAFALLAMLTALEATASNRNLIGVARNSEAQVQYIEHHQYFDSGDHWIDYYSPDLTLIVEKKLRYPGLAHHPDIVQLDLINDISISIKSATDTLLINREQANKTDRWDFKLTPDVVVDAGFDGYIRNAWETLSPGETRTLDFAVAGQRRLIKMRLSDKGYEDGHRVFVLEPNNWLVRMIVPQIRLEYTQARQLSRYEGLSNIRSKKGADPVNVDIRFQQWEGQLSETAFNSSLKMLVTQL